MTKCHFLITLMTISVHISSSLIPYTYRFFGAFWPKNPSLMLGGKRRENYDFYWLINLIYDRLCSKYFYTGHYGGSLDYRGGNRSHRSEAVATYMIRSSNKVRILKETFIKDTNNVSRAFSCASLMNALLWSTTHVFNALITVFWQSLRFYSATFWSPLAPTL